MQEHQHALVSPSYASPTQILYHLKLMGPRKVLSLARDRVRGHETYRGTFFVLLVPRFPSKSGLMNKHIVKHIVKHVRGQ
jgi:hypothetical protein